MTDTKQMPMGDAAKVGRYIIVDGMAFVVKSIQVSKNGKQGHSKTRVKAPKIIYLSV